jgi:hypothetical protein
MRRVFDTAELLLAGIEQRQLTAGASLEYAGRKWKIASVNASRIVLED